MNREVYIRVRGASKDTKKEGQNDKLGFTKIKIILQLNSQSV